jgi:fatty acid desaturase
LIYHYAANGPEDFMTQATTAKPRGGKINWYRIPIQREELSSLNRKSDLKGFVQTLGYLGILTLTAASVLLAARHAPWYVVVLALFVHGTCWNFMVNGFHELVHDSVFKTRWLNGFFLRIFSFLGWHNPIGFWASHTEHHKFTLHPPDDLEVVLPVKLTLESYLKRALVDPPKFIATMQATIRLARGRLKGEWEHHLFDDKPQLRAQLFTWARILLIGHGTILILSCALRLWMLPVVISLAPFYGAWLQFLCNEAQHAGLQDNVEDFRICCRTIYLNPLLEFLYWHMNYHTEHHMYAGVPCYHLRRLHGKIRPEMPHCPRGLAETWLGISAILKRQTADPTYQFIAELPAGEKDDSPRPPAT